MIALTLAVKRVLTNLIGHKTERLSQMGLAKTEAEWGARASAFLKAELKKAELTYAELVKRLKRHGFKETEASLTMKLKRGAFSASFFLACLAALELDGIRLVDV